MAGKPELTPRPFWYPSARGWAALGAWALAVFMIIMSAIRPELMKDQLWVQIATASIITAWGLVLGFYFASSSGSEAKQETIDKALNK